MSHNHEDYKLNTVGKIVEGDSKGHYLLIKDDLDNSGGYLILVSKNPSLTNCDEGYDNWVGNLTDLEHFFMESNWKIKWNPH